MNMGIILRTLGGASIGYCSNRLVGLAVYQTTGSRKVLNGGGLIDVYTGAAIGGMAGIRVDLKLHVIGQNNSMFKKIVH